MGVSLWRPSPQSTAPAVSAPKPPSPSRMRTFSTREFIHDLVNHRLSSRELGRSSVNLDTNDNDSNISNSSGIRDNTIYPISTLATALGRVAQQQPIFGSVMTRRSQRRRRRRPSPPISRTSLTRDFLLRHMRSNLSTCSFRTAGARMKFLCERSQSSGLVPRTLQIAESIDPEGSLGDDCSDTAMNNLLYSSEEDEPVPTVTNEVLNRAITHRIRSWFTPAQSNIISPLDPLYLPEEISAVGSNSINGDSSNDSENDGVSQSRGNHDEHSEESDYDAFNEEERAFHRQVHFSNPVSDIFEL